MSGTFSGLNTALTALWAQQRAIQVTSQNVANANTDGYSRQRVNMQSVAANAVPAMWSVSTDVGQGVNADDVMRIRDALLEARAQTEHATEAGLTVQSTTLSQIEQNFREPGDTGIQSMLANMWAGWGDVANATDPNDPGARAQLIQRTQTLVAGMHTTSKSLTDQWSQSHDRMQALLADVNATAASIADLNDAIQGATLSKLPVNELADKRDALVLHLSEQVGATSTLLDDGTMNVTVGGTTIVTGANSLTLQLSGTTDPTAASAGDPRIVTSPGGTTIRTGGTSAGLLTTMTDTVPDYLKQLDGIAQQLADQVNAVHEQGYDATGTLGTAMFGNGAGGTTGITAANLTLLITDPSKIAAAALPPVTKGTPPTTDPSADNGNADALYQLRLGVPQPDGSLADGADAIYRKMIVSLGVQSASAANNLTAQSAISSQVDASRESVSGVNLDEEMTNMLQFQHGYEAAGRLITAIDQMLDTLINKTGIVGR